MLTHFKNTLCYKVLSSKYFPCGDIFHLKVVDKPSHTWSSIAIAAKALENDFVWLVEDDNSVDIHSDNWGFEGLNGDSLCHSLLTDNERKDSDGFVIRGSGGFKEKTVFAEWEQLEAFEESLKVASTFNISKTVFESDCTSLVNRVNNRDKDITILGRRINEACKQLVKLDSVKVVWANRSCNQVADFICDFSIKNRCN
ncbi:hypothetical protein PVK06_010287 [Gossypium arboreum]|uniref:RNase H type-1 domain-containing protein n=1 Tax=Gossypium arboreum TaxID=29729 RepID=A0ABR0Q5T3_GOSAR|nr:hypothetical protein PVK06_010287 [Gossypium arboreum]